MFVSELSQVLLTDQESQGLQYNRDMFPNFQVLTIILINFYQVSDAISILDLHWILMQLGGMIENNLCIEGELSSNLYFGKLKKFQAVLPKLLICQIVFRFDTVVKQDTMGRKIHQNSNLVNSNEFLKFDLC